ncbi:hypothetical protein LSH36_583g02099 [Paralvinella palmiformis]|uniref:alanine--tRNA ligase n=1 Tax=Paralvinella palmiformis TaxID=53620 RepID=A0AAD9MWM0_9ANNE|nr:hypothetical protein LSH36_583g02099 [Paralvinella palmiformis]
MHPLVPYLLGQKHPSGTRLVNYQRCLRTGDIDSVGDDSHLTFFEMLGNWSLGAYFKEDAIAMSCEFLCSDKWLGIPKESINISVFAGDHTHNIPPDALSFSLWQNIGIPSHRIHRLNKEENWWGPTGKTGPCGPDTEMFIDMGGNTNEFPGSRYLEIWNDVFMEYYKDERGMFSLLKHPCVDTGMGIERMICILQKKKSIYETELFLPLLQALIEKTPYRYGHETSTDRALRIICDHLKTAVFLIADGVLPSNVGQGYVLRRLLRRSIRHGRKLGFSGAFLFQLVSIVQNIYATTYPFLKEQKTFIEEEILSEENAFNKTLTRGEQEFLKMLGKTTTSHISGKNAFRLYDTFGFPLELTCELAHEHGVSVDIDAFHAAFEAHRNLSRIDGKVKFKGGLVEQSEATTKLHTATHLLHQALREVLGSHISQKGSNITSDRLRFDFSHHEKMSAQEIQKTEDIVNDKIREDLPVTIQKMSLKQAKSLGCLSVFKGPDDEIITVYKIGSFSAEVCGGPHVIHTAELGSFHIQKEQSSSRGVRRIKAILKE